MDATPSMAPILPIYLIDPYAHKKELPHAIANENSFSHKTSQKVPKPPPTLSRETYIKRASALSSRNRFKEAIDIYIEAIFFYGNDSELFNLQGVCLKNLNQIDDAMNYYSLALSFDNTNSSAWNNKGSIYKEKEAYKEAISCFLNAIHFDPSLKIANLNLAASLTDLGSKLKSEGRYNEALQKYHEAQRTDPTFSPCFYNLGVIHGEMGNCVTSMAMYMEAIKLNPRYVEAYNNMGSICKHLGYLYQAITYYDRALQINPNFEMAKGNLALALTDLGTQVKLQGFLKEGIKYYKKALVYNPQYGEAHYNLGVAYGEQYKHDKALVCYRLAVSFNPRCAEAYNNLGVIYKDKENLDQAIYHYNKALDINPKFSQTLNNIGVIYTIVGNMTKAYEYTKRAIMENPNYAEAYNNLGVVYRDQGDVRLAIHEYEKSIALDSTLRNASQNRLMALNYLDGLAPDLIYNASKEWGDRFSSLNGSPYTKWNCTPIEDRTITVGYIGPDFFCHSVSYFIEAPLRYHDPSKIKVIVYANVVKEDEKTQMFKNIVPTWKSILGMNDKAVAEMIHEDSVDILIELAGHTANNRMDVMCWKAAPIQMTWIGYPNTTGLPTIDYRISDRFSDPRDTDQPYVEKLIYLPHCFLCYTPGESPPVSPPPSIENDFVTFGSFNNIAKIGPQVVALWSRVLNAVPNSRLLVKGRPFANAGVQEKFIQKFEAHGISQDRIDLLGLIAGNADHLKSYALMDIALDTFPYAGTTTTCESILMGVPVVTLKGKSNHAHNVGVSILTNIGHPELICDNEDIYVKTALELAQDSNLLRHYRESLRLNMLSSHLGDGTVYTMHLEELYRKAFKKWCKAYKS